MKIAFVSQPWNRMVPPVEMGSVAILTYEAARRLAREHEVTIYARKDPGDKPLSSHEGIRFRRFPVEWEKRLLRRVGRVRDLLNPRDPLFASQVYYLGYITRIGIDVRRSGQDVVQLFNFSQFATTIHALSPRAKIVLRMSCEWLTQLDRAVITPRLAKTNAIVGCSEFITGRIRRGFPEYANRCRTVLNGRDVAFFAEPFGSSAADGKRTKKIIYVGRVSPEKGVHVLVRAFKKVLETHPDARLEILGPKAPTPRGFVLDLTDDPNVKSLAPLFELNFIAELEKEIGPELDKRIVLRGPIPHRDLRQEYQTAAMLVFPSIWDEPSGNPPIEAMAAGIPVISTRTGGTAEYVEDGGTGILVDANDERGLAEAIERLLGNEPLRRRMGERARAWAIEMFSYERFVKDLLAVYEGLATGSDE